MNKDSLLGQQIYSYHYDICFPGSILTITLEQFYILTLLLDLPVIQCPTRDQGIRP